MPQQIISSVENNFTKGLITDLTGMNFPENAATDTDNCEYTLLGDVNRRLGINYEENSVTFFADSGLSAFNTYVWTNAGGDGDTKLLVAQVGSSLKFFNISTADEATPLSGRKLSSEIDISAYSTSGIDAMSEQCQFSDGNGYLFIFHPACNPFYCTYAGGTVSSSSISVKIRDFIGAKETPKTDVTNRPTTLNNDHKYNLLNQGWTQGSGYKSGLSVTDNPNVNLGPTVFTMSTTGLGFVVGDVVNIVTTVDKFFGGWIPAGTSVMGGTVTGYSGTTLNVNVTSIYSAVANANIGPYSIVSSGQGYIETWHTAASNYPSNADVWWYFKNSSDVFDPSTRIANVSLSSGPAPRGHYLLDAFNMDRSTTSGISGLTPVTTSKRPRTGCWFQGRIWYTGVDDSQVASGTTNFYTWSENIYFSQVVFSPDDFGKCYQQNDPTSDQLNDLLSTDGGVISIPGCGAIYKLFPIANGLLVFAANGVHFITGSQGIGFTANDYTRTVLSSIQSISGTSFVDVQGLPYFWNEEGVYKVTPSQNGVLGVESITVGVIGDYYEDIPLSSKKNARGCYDPINYHIKWIFKSTEATSLADSYIFDKILNFNTYNKAFFPYTISTETAHISGINYVAGPGGLSKAPPTVKYLVVSGNNVSFGEERDETYKDWGADNFVSYFITGYKLHGKGQFKVQVPYLFMYSNVDEVAKGYGIQAIWDYANSPNSGRWSTLEQIINPVTRFSMRVRKHRLRGRGLVLQFRVKSIDGMPFSIMGWSTNELVNSGV